jgi:hypothetical protein
LAEQLALSKQSDTRRPEQKPTEQKPTQKPALQKPKKNIFAEGYSGSDDESTSDSTDSDDLLS